MSPQWTQLSDEVRDALAADAPVVALESTILAHGFPAPDNLALGLAMEREVRAAGAVPATIAVLDGVVRVGLERVELERLCQPASDAERIAKASARDLGPVLARGGDAATTVAATATIAHHVGIRVFATGGIGGVHRGGHIDLDVSADLHTLARTPIVVVSAGVKAVLDLPRTAEVLETLGVVTVGLRTDELPSFYCRTSGVPLAHRVESAAQAAMVLRRSVAVGHPGAVLLCNPVPKAAGLDEAAVAAWIDEGLTLVAAQGVRGAAITPALLATLEKLSGGATLVANRALALANARAGAEVATYLVDPGGGDVGGGVLGGGPGGGPE